MLSMTRTVTPLFLCVILFCRQNSPRIQLGEAMTSEESINLVVYADPSIAKIGILPVLHIIVKNAGKVPVPVYHEQPILDYEVTLRSNGSVVEVSKRFTRMIARGIPTLTPPGCRAIESGKSREDVLPLSLIYDGTLKAGVYQVDVAWKYYDHIPKSGEVPQRVYHAKSQFTSS